MGCRWTGGIRSDIRRLACRCVKLRSACPAGATRSSTCRMCTASQGRSSSTSARSMSQGVWPPLTAMTKRFRASTARRASAAMTAAASRATASASASTRTFINRALPHDSGLLFLLAVTTNEAVRGAVVFEHRFRLRFEFGHNALRQHFTQFDAPLVEAIDVPNSTLRKTQCSYSAISFPSVSGVSRCTRSVFEGRLPSNTRWGTSGRGYPPPGPLRPSCRRPAPPPGQRRWPGACRGVGRAD